MGKLIKMAGLKFGRLTVIELAGMSGSGSMKWRCRCDCGTEVAVNGTSLRAGKTKSCGCYQRDAVSASTRKVMTTHGRSRTRPYRIWCAMYTRCTNPNNKDWHSYGGRGVTVCEQWSKFENFLSDMGEPPEGTSIDRIDPHGSYEPSNCRWASITEQNRNKRTNVWYEVNGKRLIEVDAEVALGAGRTFLQSRRMRGMAMPDGVRLL